MASHFLIEICINSELSVPSSAKKKKEGEGEGENNLRQTAGRSETEDAKKIPLSPSDKTVYCS